MDNKNTSNTIPSARDRLLSTAHDLFYSDGIRATGIDRIIKQAKVTKVTFYRHFPSKNDLIIAFLHYRHEMWISWFQRGLNHHGNTPYALIPTLKEWFDDDGYRGCAFINSVSELGETLAEVRTLSQQHKRDMTMLIKNTIDNEDDCYVKADAIAIAIDGAIIRAQIDNHSATALASLEATIKHIVSQ